VRVILVCMFVHMQAPWVEFIPGWEFEEARNSNVKEWAELAAYQVSLPFRPQPSQPKQVSGVHACVCVCVCA